MKKQSLNTLLFIYPIYHHRQHVENFFILIINIYMVVKNKKNYYNILGVTPDSSGDEVKISYRSLARKYHPDVNKDPESAKIFKDILEAYETLSDETRRKQYDMINGFYKTPKKDFSKKQTEPQNKKRESPKNFHRNQKDTEHPSSTERKSERENNNYNKKEKKIDENFNREIFRGKINSILDEISRSHKKEDTGHSPKNGEDVYTEVSISLTESLKGCERVLNIMHKEQCPHCSGRKFINGAKCPQCGGSGIYEIKRKITVKIPAGVKNESKLRLLGEGNPGFFGGKNGNLYITIKIEKDENIQLDNENILYKIPITPFEAVLGTEIDIDTFPGKIKFTVPPMTNSGQKFRIANKGIKTNGKFGDIIITVEIQLPKHLSEDEINMYGKLKKMSNTNIREQ